jgi:hypothetical protein
MLDIDAVSEGIMGVYACLSHAVAKLGEERVTKFLERVPERGEALWHRFRSWQRAAGENADFLGFIQSTEQSDTQPTRVTSPQRPGEFFVQTFSAKGFTWERLQSTPVGVMGVPESGTLPNNVILNGFAGPGGKVYMRAYHTPSGKFAWYEIKK